MSAALPSLGRIVLFNSRAREQLGRGEAEVPAVITRVWGPSLVNLTVLRDGETPLPVTSVAYAEDLLATDELCGWRWPDRTPPAAAQAVRAA